MDKRQNFKQFRRDIFRKISDIQDNHCAPCFHKDCSDCKHDLEIKRYGKLLDQKTAEKKEMKTMSDPKLREKYNALLVENEALKNENEKLQESHSQGVQTFLAVDKELNNTKQLLSAAEHQIDYLKDRLKEQEKVDSLQKKYQITAAALRMHLPDGLEDQR